MRKRRKLRPMELYYGQNGWYDYLNGFHRRQPSDITCSLCKRKERPFFFAHIRRHKICNNHARNFMSTANENGINHRDVIQVSLCLGILSEMKTCAEEIKSCVI